MLKSIKTLLLGYSDKIAKLDPQPNEHGIFATGYTRLNSLDENNREIYDPNWDLKPIGRSVFGAWLRVEENGYGKPDRFSVCPVKVSTYEWMNNKIKAIKLHDGWWWVKL